MAVIKSREKQVRKTRTKRVENNIVRKKLKTSLKKFNDALAQEDKDKALVLLNESVSLLDRSLTKKAHNKNFVNRHKANLHKAYNHLSD